MRSLNMRWIAGSRGRLVAAAALALALGAVEARADHVFTLSGVTFDDGGVANGTFTTDNGLTNLLSYDITTSGGTVPGFEYTQANTVSFSSLPSILVVETSDQSEILQLTFSGLTAAGAPITLGTADSFEQEVIGVNDSVHRDVTGGSVVGAGAVPEPSSLALVGTAALAGLGLWARRRRAG
jgi:PEP-CTERM motif